MRARAGNSLGVVRQDRVVELRKFCAALSDDTIALIEMCLISAALPTLAPDSRSSREMRFSPAPVGGVGLAMSPRQWLKAAAKVC
jgi:hypothetical protein